MTRSKDLRSLRALVAGGAGFIGSNLCHRLIAMGYGEVVCMDNLSTGQLRNVVDLEDNSHFTFVKHDVCQPIFINGAIDEIYNFACPASPIQYQKTPIQTFKTSVIGSINLLELAKDKDSRILLASTSEVYGDPTITPQAESYWGNVNPYGVRSCYDEGKRGAETLFHDYHQSVGIDTRIVRIFNTYGPRMATDDGRVVPNFIMQALQEKDITIYGDGMQTRSFIFIDDLIDAIIETMNDDVSHAPINIGNPHEISVNELAHFIKEQTNTHSSTVNIPLPMDDPKCRKPDISRATRHLKGWKPKVDIETGLAATIRYFEDSLSNKQKP